ncbi:MAG: hypothetical protein AB4372_02690 [Xenococcus sp. (in: cyanobacteria)]
MAIDSSRFTINYYKYKYGIGFDKRKARNFPEYSYMSISFSVCAFDQIIKRGCGMTIQEEEQFVLRLKLFKMEHQDEKFFLATTVVTMIVMFFVFDFLW